MAVPEELKENYWRVVRGTRSSGRISPSVIQKTEKQWEKFDESVIKQALSIHISHYPSYRENYTLGIMRNLQRAKASNQEHHKKWSQQFEQRKDIDFDELERDILAN